MYNFLIDWSEQNYSNLPWRKKRSMYNTLVSEIMLQQTTVSTVKNHFDRFIEKYPKLEDLAVATEEEILIDWKGLGYYRRAKNLLKAAKEILTQFGGKIPDEYDALISINGIGPYTASALISIGANKKALAIDANLERVIARLYGIKTEKGPKLQKEIFSLFESKKICTDIEDIGPRKYNEALMDLGRSICTARKAYCELCPLASDCVARTEGRVEDYPNVSDVTLKKKKSELSLVRFIVRRDNQILGYKKTASKWLSGQYEIPTFSIYCSEDEFSQYPFLDKEDLSFLPYFVSAITHYKITNHVVELDESEFLSLVKNDDYDFYPIENHNWSTASFKSLTLL